MSLARARALGAVLRLAAAASSLACVSLAASSALAQEDAGARYKLHMGNGVKLFQDGNFAAAIAEFDAAYAAQPKPNPLINIALCQKALFKYPKAIASLEKALGKQHEAQLGAADRKAATDAVAELSALLAFVDVKVTPATATVYVDDEPLPADALKKPVPLGPGQHRVAAVAPGYARADQSVSVVSGDKGKSLTFKLVADKGFISAVAADPRTAIEVDGKRMGTGKWGGLLSPGQHELAFTPVQGYRRTIFVTVAAGKSEEVKAGPDGVPIGGFAPPPGYGPAPDAPQKPKEPPKPPITGFYALASANLFTNPSDPDDVSVNGSSGAAGGLRVGYRPITLLGLELMFQYGNIVKEGSSSPLLGATTNLTYSLSSTLAGANVRLMSSGRTVRFAATLGGGFAYHTLSYEDCTSVEVAGAAAAAEQCDRDADGAEGYFNTEVGLELDFGGVLLGLVAQQVVSSSGNTKGDGENSLDHPFGGSPIVLLGGGLRIGYATW
jgi:hypothetical protein